MRRKHTYLVTNANHHESRKVTKLAAPARIQPKHLPDWAHVAIKMAVFALSYLLSAWLSLSLLLEPEKIAIIWLPTGLGVTALLLGSRRERSGYLAIAFLGNLLINALYQMPFLISAGFSLVTIIEIGLAAWILRRKVGTPFRFTRLADITWLGGVAFLIYSLTALLAAGWSTWMIQSPFERTWFTWWASHMVGLLLVLPPAVVWNDRETPKPFTNGERVTAGLIFLVLIGLCLFIFTFIPNPSGFLISFPYITYPLLFLVAARYGLPGATIASLILSFIAMIGTRMGLGPFAVIGENLIDRLFAVEIFLTITMLFTLIVAVVNQARENAEKAQLNSEKRLRSILANAPAVIGMVDRKGKILFINRFGEKHESVKLNGTKLAQWVPSESQSMVLATLNQVFETNQSQRYEMRGITTEGKGDDWFDVHLAPLANQQGVVENAVLIAMDITERKRMEHALRASEERFSLAARGANDGIWDWDLTASTVYYSPRWKQMLDYEDIQINNSPDEWLGRIHPEDLAQLKADLTEHLAGRTPHFINEHRLMTKNGAYRWVLTRGLAILEDGQSPHRLVGSLTDITDRKMAEQQLLHDAMHDTLTGLPNRPYFIDQLRRAIERSKRHPENLSAILFIDLDRFKLINDSLGHASGDQVLFSAARRLEGCLRPEDTIARFGGDEYAVLLDNIANPSVAAQVAARVLDLLAQPFMIQGNEIFVTASIGITLTTHNAERAEDMLRDVDTAMYQAKANGRNRFQMFDREMHARSLARLRLEADLRRAIERKEFEVYYQPVIALPENRITAFEALLRWRHPEQGLILPGQFLEVAEETGMIVPINEWVLRIACAQLKAWQVAVHPGLRISVNLPVRMLQDSNLPTTVQNILTETGISNNSLMLEITENDAMQDFDQTMRTLTQLNEMGVQISLDDFGMRYSSLDYLKRFPVSIIKIDRSFIAEVTQNPNNAAIANAIISVAHVLNKTVVAEGVEEVGQVNFLNSYQCDEAQGFLYCHPQPAQKITELMQNGMLIHPSEAS